MAYPAEWETTFRSRSGVELVFRPELASDTEMLWEMFSTLSEASTSNLVPPFTRQRIEGWTSNIDYRKVLPIVAIIDEAGKKQIVGSASLKFEEQEVFKHKAELGLTVHDNYQNQGIGTALLDHMITIGASVRLRKIFLIVNTTNFKAIHVYQKAGFQIEGVFRQEMRLKDSYLDEYRMALFL